MNKTSAILYGLAFLAAIAFYGCSNHSRNFTVNVDEDSTCTLTVEAKVDKTGNESSANTPDISPTLAMPLP